MQLVDNFYYLYRKTLQFQVNVIPYWLNHPKAHYSKFFSNPFIILATLLDLIDFTLPSTYSLILSDLEEIITISLFNIFFSINKKGESPPISFIRLITTRNRLLAMLVSPDVSVRANLGIVVASKSQFMPETRSAALAQLGISLENTFIGIASDRHRDLPAGLAVAVSHHVPARRLFRNPVRRINVNQAAVLVCHVVDGISRHEAVGIQLVVDQADALNQRYLASGKSPLADIADPAAVNLDIVIPSAPGEFVGSGLDMGQL